MRMSVHPGSVGKQVGLGDYFESPANHTLAMPDHTEQANGMISGSIPQGLASLHVMSGSM
jgi:hypothetical protein